MAVDEIQQMKAQMASLVQEQADRRALHQRKVVEIKAKAQEYMTKQALAAERYVEHRRELGLLEMDEPEKPEEEEQEEVSDGVTEIDFAPEDFDDGEGDDIPPPAPAPAAPEPPAAPPIPVASVPERTPRRARPKPVDDEDDDDDFLNNRWRDDD